MTDSKHFKVKVICPGKFKAPALITRERLSLLGGLNAEKGLMCDPRSELYGTSFAGKTLIFTSGKGSSLWSTILGNARRYGTAPAAIINLELDTFVVFACVVSEIPMLQLKDDSIFDQIKNGEMITFSPAGAELVVTPAKS